MTPDRDVEATASAADVGGSRAPAPAAEGAGQHATFRRISQIALAGHPIDETYRLITGELERASGFAVCVIALHDAARGRLRFKGARRAPFVDADGDLEVGLDESLSGVVVRTGRPLVWTDADPPLRLHERLRALGVRVFVGVPMTVDGVVIGAVAFADPEPRPVAASFVDFATDIADHVALLTERARALEALRASERHLHAVFDAAVDAMILIDEEGRYIAANPAAAALIGLPVAELLTHRAGDFAVPGTDVEGIVTALKGGRLRTAEWRLLRPDGNVRDIESSITPNILPGRHLSLLRDVTDRKRADTERRVRAAALTAAANGIVITDAEGRIEWVNPEFTRMTGYTLEEMHGQTPRLLKSGQHDDAFYAALWATIRRGRVWRGEMTNRRKDGTLYLEEQSITPVRANGRADNRVTHFVAVKQDISERRRAEDTLRRSEEYHRALLDNALDILTVLDADGVFRYASPSIERALGERPDDIVGTNALERLHPDDLPAVSRLFFDSQGTPGFTATVEYRYRHRDGSWRHLEAVACNLLHHPAVAGVIVSARDITERKRDEATQEQLRAHLRQSEKLAAMSELLAGVAHELNNPLSVVIGHTALLARVAEGPVAARAEKIGRAAERCGRIVKNFLALARQYPPERTQVDLNQVVREALEVVAYPLRVDTVDVVTELAPGLPRLSADSHQLQQVLVNLVTNAHQAMRGSEGARRLTVRTGALGPAGPVWLEVADTGPGILPAVQARLFEPFFTTKPLGQGTGLGLSICRGIVEGHGGRIGVEGGPGRGATFRVELPLGEPAAPPPAPTDEGPKGPPRRVLVVDDEIEVAHIVSEVLERDGHQVTTAANGIEALDCLREGTWDVVISDVKMPRLDGPGLWAAVRTSDPVLAARFVFITGDTLAPATAEFLERVGLPNLRKPFSLRDVRVALAAVPLPAGRA
jgi:nitrogen fixation negative regulator NifL